MDESQGPIVVLGVEDLVPAGVAEANASLGQFETRAQDTHAKFQSWSDQSTSSVKRLITALEKQNQTYGRSEVEKLIYQKEALIQKFSKEQAAVEAITTTYNRQIEVAIKAAQAEADAERKRTEAINARAKAVADAERAAAGKRTSSMLQDPLGYLKSSATEALVAIGPVGGAIAGITVALGGMAVAGFEATKSLGEWGTRIHDVQVRTGLTAKEVGQFAFAARAVGQDVSVFERTMRGLTAAIEDDSTKAQAAREMLRGFGVDIQAVRQGTATTSDVLLKISEGLNAMPNTFERNAAGIAIFKKAWIELAPAMLEVGENVARAKELGFGPSEEDIERARGYERVIAEIDTEWERFMRAVKEPIAIAFTTTWKGLTGETADDISHGMTATLKKELPKLTLEEAERRFNIASSSDMLTKPDWDSLQKLLQQKRDKAFVGQSGIGGGIAGLHLDLSALSPEANDKRVAQAREPIGAVSRAEKALKAAQDSLVLSNSEDWKPGINDATLAKIETLKQQVEQEKNLATFRKEAATFEAKGDEAELGALGKIYYMRDKLLKQGAEARASEADLAGIWASAAEQAGVEQKKIDDAFNKEAVKQFNAREEDRFKLGLVGPGKGQLKDWDDVFKAQERIEGIDVQAQRDLLRRRGNLEARRADTPEEAYRVRVGLAIQLAEIEVARIEREENAAKRMVLAAEAQRDLSTELAKAEDERDEKRAAAEQKRTEELQRQVDELQKMSSGLLHTLFTKPGDFPKQLGGTLQDAILKPVTDGFGGMIANALHPLIYGSDGQGGVSGLLHGAFGGPKQDPITVTADNTAATTQNSKAIWLLTAVLSEYMGRNVPALSTQGSSGVPNLGVASPSGFLNQMLRNTGGLPRFAEGGVTNGPTIVGEAGRELVIPLDKLLAAPEPNSPFPYLHGYGPDTEEALGKLSMGLMNIALPASLTGIGGPAGLEVGNVAMSLLMGGLSVATPPRADGVLQGVLPTGPQRFTPGSLKWAVNPATGKVRLAPFENSADITSAVETHADWFHRIGLPSSGPEYDRISRGYAYINSKGLVRIDDNGLLEGGVALMDPTVIGPPPVNNEQLNSVVAALQRRFPGSGFDPADVAYMENAKASISASVRAPSDLARYSGQTLAQRAASRMGGLVTGAKRSAERAARVPEVDLDENAIREANVRFDAQFADDAGNPYAGPERAIDWVPKTNYRGPGQGAKVLFGGEQMTFAQIAKLYNEGSPLPMNANSFRHWMTTYVPREQWDSFDLLKGLFQRGWRGMGKLPSNALEAEGPNVDLWKELSRGLTGLGLSKGKLPTYDEGGTVVSTGVAVVHQGEAVVPQADTLKHSVDANTKALQAIPGALMVFVRSIGSRMAQAPLQQRGSVVVVSGAGAGAAEQPMVGVPEVMTGSDSMSSTGWGAGVDPYSGQVYQPGPLPPTFGGSTVKSHSFSLPASLGSPTQMLHTGSYTAGTALLSSGVRTGNPLTSAMGGAAMGYGLAPMMGTTGTWGAVTGAGAGVAMAGLERGGASGTAMTTGGGALIGFQMGGPLGAAIGAVAGLGAGLIREFGVETLPQTAQKDIKQLYGVDIPVKSGVINQIVDMAKSQFGGSISMAVRSPSVRQLVMLYAESTGQKMPLSSTTPRAGSLVEQGGSLYQAPTFQNGTPYVLPSSIPSVANLPGMGTYPMPGGGPIQIAMHIDGASTADFMTRNYVTPTFVQDQTMAAQNSSYNRLQDAANAQQPGLYV